MSNDFMKDMRDMHTKFGHGKIIEYIAKNDKAKLAAWLELRKAMIGEELQELTEAIDNNDTEEVVDALIDISVFALGTLDLLQVDGTEAWSKVYNANMEKITGVKEGRPNPFNLPDMIKPIGWKTPSHEGNHGLLEK